MSPGVGTYGLVDREPGDYLLGVKANALKRFTDFPNVNLVINGAMLVNQAYAHGGSYANVGSTGGSPLADMFIHASTTAANVTISHSVTDAPVGFKSSIKIEVTAADASIAAGDKALIYHAIEGYRLAPLGFGSGTAMSASIGFWVKAHRTGIYCLALLAAASVRSYIVEYTINVADTWEYKTATIPGDVAGTWGTTSSVGVYIYWTIMAGSTLQSTANSWLAASATCTSNQVNGFGAIGDTFQLAGVSLVAGTVPIPQELSRYIFPTFEDELTRCQRYYEKSFDYEVAPAQNVDASFSQGSLVALTMIAGAVTNRGVQPFKVRKRSVPSMTSYNPAAANAQARNLTTGTDATATAISGTQTAAFMSYTGPGGGAIGDRVAVHWTADSRL